MYISRDTRVRLNEYVVRLRSSKKYLLASVASFMEKSIHNSQLFMQLSMLQRNASYGTPAQISPINPLFVACFA